MIDENENFIEGAESLLRISLKREPTDDISRIVYRSNDDTVLLVELKASKHLLYFENNKTGEEKFLGEAYPRVFDSIRISTLDGDEATLYIRDTAFFDPLTQEYNPLFYNDQLEKLVNYFAEKKMNAEQLIDSIRERIDEEIFKSGRESD